MSLLRTPLFENVKAKGGRFVPFGGWEMAVQFAGIQSEHDAVRTGMGIFDVSHMGEIEIRGRDALAAVNRLITNDLTRIADGQALYTCMCQPDGGIVDDLVVYRYGPEHIFICCNASNREKDFAWIVEHLTGEARAVDRSVEFAQLAVQGPAAPALVQRLTRVDLSPMKRYWFAEGEVAGIPSIISRTGYTGEDGFELYVPAAQGGRLWDALFDAADGALHPIGLGARDTLRLEMKFALYGNDIDATTSPLEAGLGWVTRLDKEGGFIGQDVLRAQKASGLTRGLIGFQMQGKVPARHGYAVVDADGQTIGTVTSGSFSPTLKTCIGMAYVPKSSTAPGSQIFVQVRDRAEAAVVVKTPFVAR
ncbi:glycine cleavage system aminomethyltransferase GcvT [Myxococcota bacterium]|nr:glycine cleavage system aminomethyltransferase GcvT [Myxococcota bacterium]